MPIARDRILYDDDHLLVVNKLARELAVEAGGEGKASLHEFLRKQYPGLRPLHRLDFGTSGVMAFGKTKEVAEKVRDTKLKGWKKTYVALVAGHMTRASGTIEKQLKARTHEGDVPAVSHYHVLQAFPFTTFVEVTIDTGRKHQIRQHLASIGHPLLCDPLYGNEKADRNFTKHYGYRHFFLHAAKLSLPHPATGKLLHLQAPLPRAFQEAVSRLHH